ncbi:MAG: hypothetical protein NDJ24_08370 [Alphaproteobacteria bacterium]|nr:hypothetical protein [Alphaproteobacteria bacterium]
MFSLRKVFRDVMASMEAARVRKELYPVVLRAIDAKNMPVVEKIFDTVEFDGRQTREIVKAAIVRDDVALFDLALKKVLHGNVNYALSEHSSGGPEGPSHTTICPILSYAIEQGSRNVALRLANDEQTNVSKQGVSTTHIYISGGMMGSGHCERTDRYHAKPLDLARKAGMGDVLIVLLERTADLRRAEAYRLDHEAKTLAIG